MSGKVRPILRKGDLVKHKSGGKAIMRVIGYSSDVRESRKLGHRGRQLSTTDGACIIYVATQDGHSLQFPRRNLWKIPDKDQPRYRWKHSQANRDRHFLRS